MQTVDRDSPVIGGPGLTGEQWARYSRQLRRLGIAQVTKGDGMVEFRVDTGTIWNGSSYKGYEYGLTPPVGHRKTSLDRYRVTASDKIFFGEYYIYQVYKPLKDNWYLYLFVN